MITKPYWGTTSSLPTFAPISQDLQVDVVVIGAGLTGITTAYLLKKAGAKVVLLDRQRCVGADSGHTTAHLTYVTDTRLNQLVKSWGCDGAKAFWEAGSAAIDEIFSIAQAERLDCELKWVPGYLHGALENEKPNDRESLQKDAQLARELGFKAEFVESVPYAYRPGVRFEGQAKFHPLKYLGPLLQRIHGDGRYVFENSEASEIESDPLTVHAGRFKIRCSYLVIATHTPLMGKTGTVSATLFQTKLMLYTSYVLGATLPKGRLPEALFWDTTDPAYYYLRVDRRPDHDYIIFGGKDEKTGQESGPVFEALEAVLKRVLPESEVQHRWLGQVVETSDGLPFIGESAGQQFIATGFCGNGFTLGTLSAVMARDRFLGRHNPWYDLFAVDRKQFHGGAWRFLAENLDYPYYSLRDRLRRVPHDSPADLEIEEGKIVQMEGKKVAAYRGPDGKVTLLSPVCTHLGCLVRWNGADSTWDCPCHGSRFKPTGEVYAGPAESPLQRLPWAEEQEKRYDKAA
jgi:glycine/D-amino acid oxidase-like deaminating enzyme/nitrite reductase/ring-hydroxylating ferredoxin subunit